MKDKFRRIFMGLCLHILLSCFLLAGIRVMQSGYNHSHGDQICAANLSVTKDSAELSVLSQTLRIPLPPQDSALPLIGYVLTDETIKLWVGLLSEFTN